MLKPVSFRFAVAACALVISAAGCRCGPPPLNNSPGELTLVYVQDGNTVTGEDAVYDFGSVAMGKQATLKLGVKNTGTGSLTLTSLEKQSGDAVKIGQAVSIVILRDGQRQSIEVVPEARK